MATIDYNTPIGAAMGQPAVTAEEDQWPDGFPTRAQLQAMQAAQAQQAPALQSAMQPQEDPSALQSLYQRMVAAQQGVRQRGDASSLWDGFINGGAAMLQTASKGDLAAGLGQGVQAFNDSYDARTDKDRALNTPKVVPLSDGAFTLLAYPDGTQKVVKNSEVAQFLNDKAAAASQAGMLKTILGGFVQAGIADHKDAIKNAQEAQETVNQAQATLDNYKQAKEIVANRGIGGQIQGLPGISSIAEAIGTDESIKNKFLQGLTVDETLLNTAKTKGAISDYESKLFKTPIPSATSSDAVWNDFIDRRMAVIQKIIDNKQKLVEAGKAPMTLPGIPGIPQVGGGSAVPPIPVVAGTDGNTTPELPATATPTAKPATPASAPAKTGAWKYLD